uniref:Uncharacterized protein n=1 Tax=Romanomermis culicivorax TaxID=13658 RepID=A0A915KVW5_ROMCU
MIIGGFFGAFSSAFLVDKTKKFAEIMKLAFALAVLAGVVF